MAYVIYYLGIFLQCYHLIFKTSNFENKINFKELNYCLVYQINPLGPSATLFLQWEAVKGKVEGNLIMTQCRQSLVCLDISKSEEKNSFFLKMQKPCFIADLNYYYILNCQLLVHSFLKLKQIVVFSLWRCAFFFLVASTTKKERSKLTFN